MGMVVISNFVCGLKTFKGKMGSLVCLLLSQGWGAESRELGKECNRSIVSENFG